MRDKLNSIFGTVITKLLVAFFGYVRKAEGIFRSGCLILFDSCSTAHGETNVLDFIAYFKRVKFSGLETHPLREMSMLTMSKIMHQLLNFVLFCFLRQMAIDQHYRKTNADFLSKLDTVEFLFRKLNKLYCVEWRHHQLFIRPKLLLLKFYRFSTLHRLKVQ